MRETNPRRAAGTSVNFIFSLVFSHLIANVVGASDDVTNIYSFGCRWYGGTTTMVSCNCTTNAEEMYIQRNSIPAFDTTIIEIHNCAQVRFGAYSIHDLRNLRRVSLNNIGSLTFERNSLNWVGYRDTSINQEERFELSIPSLKVQVKHSHITTIDSYSFVGRINEISIENSQIDNIAAFAFSSLLQTETLSFRDVVLREVTPQSFKKFGTEFLVFDGVQADYLPSKTIANITVYRSFIIKNCKFHTLRPATFIVNNPAQFSVVNNDINQLEGEAFLLSTTGDVTIKNNNINNVHDHAFMGITLNTQEVSSSRVINFDSNTFGNIDGSSLEVQPHFEARVSNLNLNQSCDCETIVSNMKQVEFYSEIRCLDGDRNFVTVGDFKGVNCSVFAGYYHAIIGVCVIVVVIGVIGGLFYVYYWYMYRRQKYGCKKGAKPPMSLIVPDGRTYKETELHVIVEKADLLTTDL